MQFLPVVFLFFLLYLGLLIGLFVFVQIEVISFAFRQVGVSPNLAVLLLLGCLLGSLINIPITRIKREQQVVQDRVVEFFGWRFRVPNTTRPLETVITINLGGAVIPVALSVFVLVRNPGLVLGALGAIGIVSVVVYQLSQVKKGAGIVVPMFVPPVLAGILGLVLGGNKPPLVAYVCGTLGTLIGADLFNLKEIKKLEAPVVSIGGAGTFDGIFLTGIIAVLIASIL